MNQTYLALLLFVNLAFYIIFTLFYDSKLLKKENTGQSKLKPPAWDNLWIALITTIPSLGIWLLFVILPIVFLLDDDLLLIYSLPDDVKIIINFFQILGIVFISIGTLIAFLGRKARRNDAISWGIPNRLVTTGLHAYIRHPLYSSYIFYFFGFFLIFPSIFTVIPIFGIFGYWKTVSHEEKILIKTFGNQYKEYMKRTGRFLPKLSSLF